MRATPFHTTTRNHHRRLAVLCLCLLLLAGCRSTPVGPILSGETEEQNFYKELAAHYAPVITHGAAGDQDFITAVDFDGDWIGNNNWANQPDGDLSAVVYYSVIATETHWFIFYSLFHPRDYVSGDCAADGGCHENDLESIQLVVAQDDSQFGRLQLVQTLAHGDIFLYPVDPAVTGGFLKPAGQVRFEDSHPIVYVETYGHGIYGTRKILFPGVITYRVGETAETPSGIDDDVSYELRPIYETLWRHRDEIGPGQAFDGPFDYRGRTLAAAFDGAQFGEDRANTPWGYDQAIGDVLSRGDWFLDPAHAILYHAHFPGEFSTTYTDNPYLADLELLAANR